ncbi:fimbrial protein [Pseudomonas sp. LS.1a]|uniref:fimbrial protein n=1 Tax=Pseudomonas sp. LS.1a TaxID=2920387 RepID=UPI001F12EC97|nr:fimbrial protein [Pseudomonas sp. LS.1a]UMY63016.1 type 1 fimbrial protein [Pseudomonas sp. LS.1a]
MTTFTRQRLRTALLFASLPFITLQAAYAASGCATQNGPGPAVFTADFTNVWVPRDLPVGEPIVTKTFAGLLDPSATRIQCDNDGSGLLEARIDYTAPFAHNLPMRLGNGRFANRVVRTRIAGIGAVIEMRWPFAGQAFNNFYSAGSDNTVPYYGTNNRLIGAPPLFIGPLYMDVTLVKTGPIASGPILLDEELAHGSTTDVPDAFRLRTSATLHQAQCTLKSDAVSADPVDLGSHTVADFPGKGTTTTSIPFHITLSDCEDDPAASTATAYIYLTGTDGSVAIDPKLGLFSLGNGSTAKGIGIQITDDLGVPVPLQEHVSSNKKLELPLTRLPYRAHFYQTDDRVTPGSARGALDFTISYR